MWLYTIEAPDGCTWRYVFDAEIDNDIAIREFKKDSGHDCVVSCVRHIVIFKQSSSLKV